MLTATFKDLHVDKQQKLQKVILFSSTMTRSQCDAGNITFVIFAVFDVQVLKCCC